MPAPGQMAPHRDDERYARMLAVFSAPDEHESSLAREVAALRKEIAELRAELAPVQSLIVTGRQVIDEFKRLAKPPRGCA